MIPVQQMRFGQHDGNCHAACIASIFEVPLEEVPQATEAEMASPDAWQGYEARLRDEFCHPRNVHAMDLLYINPQGKPWSPFGYSILVLRSEAGGMHAVVALDGQIVHDPHPARDVSAGEPYAWTIFTVLDPTKPIAKPESQLSESILDDIRAAEPGWVSTPARCGACNHFWVAVWPLDLERDEPDSNEALDEGIAQLECPHCHQQGQTRKEPNWQNRQGEETE